MAVGVAAGARRGDAGTAETGDGGAHNHSTTTTTAATASSREGPPESGQESGQECDDAVGDVHADEDEFEFDARAQTVVGGEHAGHEEPRAVGPETAEVARVRQVPSRIDEEPVSGAHRRREARVTRAGVARPPRAGANAEGCRSFFGCRRGPGAECQVWPPSASVGHARLARRRDALADAPIAADAEGNVAFAVAVAGEGHVRGAEGGVPRVQGRRRG